MTKQQEIEEMAEVLSDDFCATFDDGQGQDCSLDCDKCRAHRVVEAGYRKADEVRKETLKEIFSWLHIRTKNGRVIDDTVLIKTAKETFGVEVDE